MPSTSTADATRRPDAVTFDPATPSFTAVAFSIYVSMSSTIDGSIVANFAANGVRLPNFVLFLDSFFISACSLLAADNFTPYSASLNTFSA